MIAKPLPRVLSPRAHAAADCLRIGIYLAGAGWFWKRNRRAAVAALACAGAETALVLLTDYDGRSGKEISFRSHRSLDLGLASMAAAMPGLLSFEREPARKLFLAQGALSTGIIELTQFGERNGSSRRRVPA